MSSATRTQGTSAARSTSPLCLSCPIGTFIGKCPRRPTLLQLPLSTEPQEQDSESYQTDLPLVLRAWRTGPLIKATGITLQAESKESCSSVLANTWTMIYEPYTYPHPLTVTSSSHPGSRLSCLPLPRRQADPVVLDHLKGNALSWYMKIVSTVCPQVVAKVFGINKASNLVHYSDGETMPRIIWGPIQLAYRSTDCQSAKSSIPPFTMY